MACHTRIGLHLIHFPHHLPHFFELGHKAVDLLDGSPGTGGDTLATAAVQQFGVGALQRCHGADHGFDRFEGVVRDLHVLHHLAHARDHGNEVLDGAHLLELLQLGEEVVDVELVLADLGINTLGLFLVVDLLGTFYQADDVAHAQDTLGHTIGVELVKLIRLLAGADELYRLLNDGADGQSGTAAAVAVEFGEDNAVEVDAVVEGFGRVHGILARHGVYDEERLGRIERSLHALDLVHHGLIYGETACCIDDDDLFARLPGLLDAALGDADRIGDTVFGVYIHADRLTHDLELVDSGRAVYVGCHEQHLTPTPLVESGQFGGERRLTRALQTREQYDGRIALQHHIRLVGTHEAHQLIVDDLGEELAGFYSYEYFLAKGLLQNLIRYLLGNLVVHVGIHQGAADFFDGLGNVDIRDAALPFKGLDGTLKAGVQILEHGKSCSALPVLPEIRLYWNPQRYHAGPAPRFTIVHICLVMRKLLALALLLASYPALAQLRTGAGYDCEEELFPRYDKATRTFGYVNMVGQWRVEPVFTKAERFQGRLAVVQRGTKFGLLNCQGQLAANTIYDEIQNFVNGRGWARQGTLWGLLDEKGRLVVPPAFEDIRPVAPRNELTWVKKKGIWGVFSKDRLKMLVEPRYDACRSLSDSLGLGLRSGYIAPIYLGTGQVIYDSCTIFDKAGGNTYRFTYRKKDGLMSADGSVLMRPEYDTIRPFKNYILACKSGHWAVASLLGKLETGFDFDAVKGSEALLIAARKGGKWGYVLPSGKVYVPFEYEDAITAHGLYYGLRRGKGPNAAALLKTDEKMKPEDFKYRYVSIPFPEYPVVNLYLNDSAWELLDMRSGKKYPSKLTGVSFMDYDPRFLMIDYAGEGRNPNDTSAPVARGFLDLKNFDRYLLPETGAFPILLRDSYVRTGKSGALGLINIDTKATIIPRQYDYIYAIEGTTYFAAGKRSDFQTTVYNETGKVLFTFGPTNDLAAYKPGYYVFRRDYKKSGLLKAPDQIIIKPEYDRLTPSGGLGEREGLPLIAKKKGKFSLLSAEGKELSESYDSLAYIGQAYYVARTKAGFQLLDRAGKEIPNQTYESVGRFADGLLLVTTGGKPSYLNRSLKPAFTLPLETADPFENGTARVKTGGRYVRINKQGKIVQLLD